MLQCSLPVLPALPMPGGVPAWLDPRLVMALTAVRFTAFETNMGNVVQLVPADPKRVAFGIFERHTEMPNLRISPVDDPNVYGWTINPTGPPTWLDLFTYGSLVTLAWNVTSDAQSLFYVAEVYRLS